MNDHALISVIVPIFRVEKFLKKCVNSLICQTYRNIEVLLIDDGSPDGCPKMCDEYSLTDNRIRVIHKANGGLSDARNSGVKESKGDYIVFVDGDDWVEPTYCEELVSAAIENDSNIVECAYFRVLPNGDRVISNKAKGKSGFLTSDEWITEKRLNGFLTCVVWNKLYKASVVKKFLFPKARLFEDEATTYKFVYDSGLVFRINRALYNYRDNSGSISNTKRITLKGFHDMEYALNEKCSFFKERNETRLERFSYYRLCLYYISVFNKAEEIGVEKLYILKKVKECFKEAKKLKIFKYIIYTRTFILLPFFRCFFDR